MKISLQSTEALHWVLYTTCDSRNNLHHMYWYVVIALICTDNIYVLIVLMCNECIDMYRYALIVQPMQMSLQGNLGKLDSNKQIQL